MRKLTLNNITIKKLYHDVNCQYGTLLGFTDKKEAKDFLDVMRNSDYFNVWLDIPLYEDHRGEEYPTSFFRDLMQQIQVVKYEEVNDYIKEYEIDEDDVLFQDSGFNVAIVNYC